MAQVSKACGSKTSETASDLAVAMESSSKISAGKASTSKIGDHTAKTTDLASSATKGFRFLDLPGELRNEIVLKWLFPTPDRPAYFDIRGEIPGCDEIRDASGMYRVCKAVYSECPTVQDLLANGSILLTTDFEYDEEEDWDDGFDWAYDRPKELLEKLLPSAARFRLTCVDFGCTPLPWSSNSWQPSTKAGEVMKLWLKQPSTSQHSATEEDRRPQGQLRKGTGKVLEFYSSWLALKPLLRHPGCFVEALIPLSLDKELLRNLQRIELGWGFEKEDPEMLDAANEAVNRELCALKRTISPQHPSAKQA